MLIWIVLLFIVDLSPLPQAGHSQRIVEAVAILFDVIEKVDQSNLCHFSSYLWISLYM